MTKKLTKDEAENLANYTTAVTLGIEEIAQQASAPINDAYCWHHSGDGNGGWACKLCRLEDGLAAFAVACGMFFGELVDIAAAALDIATENIEANILPSPASDREWIVTIGAESVWISNLRTRGLVATMSQHIDDWYATYGPKEEAR